MAAVSELVQWIAGVTAVVNGTPRTAESVNAGLTDLANRTRWLKRLYDLLVGAPLTVSAVDTGADELTVTSHGIPANTAIQIFAVNGGSLPGGLSEGVPYWVGVVDANTIQLYTGAGPAGLVDLTPGFVGDVYVQIIPDWLSVLLLADATYGTGKLTDLIVFLAGSQTITGAKAFADITVSGTNQYKVASRSVTRAINLLWYDLTNKCYGYVPSVPAGERFTAPLDLPHGATLTNITITIDPDNVLVLPGGGSKPNISWSGFEVSTGSPVDAGGPIDDASVDAAAYNPPHDISSGALSISVDNENNTYWIGFDNPSADPVKILGVRATCTVTAKRHWS